MGKKQMERQEMLLGTLDMLILRTLRMGAAHGHTIARVIEQTSDEVLQVEQGSLYPALHRLEHRRLISAEWRASENSGRRSVGTLTIRWPQSPRPNGLVRRDIVRRCNWRG